MLAPDITLEELLMLLGDREATIYRLRKQINQQSSMIDSLQRRVSELEAPPAEEPAE